MMTTSMLLVAWALAQAPVGGPARVAVVDVPTISEKYARTKELEREIESVRVQFNQERDARRAEIERLNRALEEQFKPGTPDYTERREQLVVLDAKLKSFVESEGAKLERKFNESLMSIFEDIRNAVRTVAQAQGIDVVMAADRPPEVLPDSAAVLRNQLLLQKVLYFHPRVDITQEVIQQVNESYQQRRAVTPGGNAPPSDDPARVIGTGIPSRSPARSGGERP